MLIRLLATHLRPHRRALALLVVLQVAQTAATLLLPALNGVVVDEVVGRGDPDAILRTGAAMLGVALAQIATACGAAVLGARVSAALGRDLRSALFGHVLRLSAREVGRFGAPSLVTRTVNDVQQVQSVALTGVDIALPAVVMCVGGVVMSLLQDVPLALLLVALVVLVAAALVVVLVRLGPSYELVQRSVDHLNLVLRERISGVRVIRAFVRDAHERDRFSRANSVLFGLSLRVGRMVATIPVLLVVAMNALVVAMIWVAGHRVGDGGPGLGAVSALLGYVMLTITAITMLTLVFAEVSRARVSAARVAEVLDTRPGVPAPARPARPGALTGHVEVRAAEFGYPGAEKPVLRGVDLLARPGEVVAVLGATGSGKTTLLNLVLRLFDVTAGAVLVDGLDVRLHDPDALRRSIGYVPQKAHLFSGTVRDNLRYGNPDAGDAQVWHAIEVAQARDFVERMGGLDAAVAQGGANLSGGQRQRLAIARALVRRPRVYLFDDCFSALDQGTEAALRAALVPETAGATTVVVAQRISAVRDADRIVVLDDGCVVGAGTHEELLRHNQTYREIALSQAIRQEQPHVLVRQP